VPETTGPTAASTPRPSPIRLTNTSGAIRSTNRRPTRSCSRRSVQAWAYITLNCSSLGAFSRPHFHPNDRFITVVKGTWWVGTGTKFDPNDTVAMPTGTYVTHFGKEIHWDGAKDEEAWVLIVGEGPATSTRVEETK
jgi:hypothetical protein